MKMTVLFLCFFLFSLTGSAKPDVKSPRSSFKQKVMDRFDALLKNRPVTLSSELKEIAQNRTYVGYPGGVGLQPWVWFDNWESLRVDFGVPQNQIWHRDPPKGLHVSHTPAQGVWGESVKFSVVGGQGGYVQVEKEAEALYDIYKRSGEKPLILLCHSSGCRHLVSVGSYLRDQIGDGKWIERVVIMQGGFSGNSIAADVNRNDQIRRQKLRARGMSAEDIQRRSEELFPSQMPAFFYVSDNGRLSGPEPRYGHFLGDLSFGHTEAVVSFDQKAARGGQFISYRNALTQVLLETLYPDAK